MQPESDTRIQHARSTSGDELNALLHESDEQTLFAILENANLQEQHVTVLLERLDLPVTVLTALAGEGKWTSSEGIRLRLASHPRTPKRFAVAAVRQLFLFDLVRLSLLPSAPPDIRRVAEEVILTRVPHIQTGERLTLARRGSARVTGAILAEGHPRAVKLALANPFLTESQVLKVLATASVPERVVQAIAEHPKWSCRYNVRAALARNARAPVAAVIAFLADLTLRDLRDICAMESLVPAVRRHIEEELARRAEAAAEEKLK
jgi:hypothetical protein